LDRDGLGWAEFCCYEYLPGGGSLHAYSLYGRSQDVAKETAMFDGRQVAVMNKEAKNQRCVSYITIFQHADALRITVHGIHSRFLSRLTCIWLDTATCTCTSEHVTHHWRHSILNPPQVTKYCGTVVQAKQLTIPGSRSHHQHQVSSPAGAYLQSNHMMATWTSNV
jgi:hypothetical protein